MAENPAVDTFVRLDFEGKFKQQSPIEGRVIEVNTNTDIKDTTMYFIVNDVKNNRKVMYCEGIIDEKEWSNISVINRDIILGNNAKWRNLQ